MYATTPLQLYATTPNRGFPTNLGGRASQVAKREIFLALIEHGPHHFFHKQLLNTHIAFEQLLNAHILLLNCSTCTMAIMLAQPIEKNTL